jgi:O-glycosyl hydrolase
VSINVSNFQPAGVTKAWQLSSSNTIAQLPDMAFNGTALAATIPAQSITIFVIPQGSIANPPSPPTNVRITPM